jgi:DNA repair protein RadC
VSSAEGCIRALVEAYIVMSEKYHVAIKDLPPEERPRERLERYGADSLSTAELLAIILRTGTREESALRLAEKMLMELSGLRNVAQAEVAELRRIKGIGAAKAVEVKAALELGKRLVALGGEVLPAIHSPTDVVQLLAPQLRDERQEQFKVLLLDTKNQVRRVVTATVGTLNASLVHPREVFRAAVAQAAHSIILAHNHPSGDPTPSKEDVAVTVQLVNAGKILGIEVLDHVIIGDGRYVSMRERGLM